MDIVNLAYIEVVRHFHNLTNILDEKQEPREKVKQQMVDMLQKNYFSEALSNLQNPLDPSLKCQSLKSVSVC